MLSVFIFLIITIFKAEARGPDNENPVIRLSYDGSEDYTVLKDKPLTIVIENAYVRFVWCFNYSYSGNFKIFVRETEFSNDIINKLNIANVTAEMSTTWACMFLQEYKRPDKPYPYKKRIYSAKLLQFNLHVKGAGAVILIANNQSLTYVTTNLSVNYDGEANYIYEDGEDFPMDFSCIKAKDNHEKDTLRLEYYNPEGILLFQTKPRVTQHIFRSVLKSNNDKYYLDCIRAAINPDREYRYRTTFLKKICFRADALQHEVILSVNGQKLTSCNKHESYYDDYIFKYIDGEVLNVTCRKMDVNKRGTLTFYSIPVPDVNSSQTWEEAQDGAVISLNISTSGIQNKSVTCNINNTDVEKPNAQLIFLSDVPDNDVRIRGLPRSNILYQYTNDEDQWTIEYQYSVNDTLDLTCVLKSHWRRSSNSFQWIFEDEKFYSAAIAKGSTPVKFSEKPFTKILDATHNGTKITCIFMFFLTINKTVEIILRLNPELVSKTIVSGETSTNSYTLVYCLTAAGVSVIIIIVILYLTVKNSCCSIRSNSQELPAPRPHPDTPFYENLLAVFQPINEQEAAQMENHYEEIQ